MLEDSIGYIAKVTNRVHKEILRFRIKWQNYWIARSDRIGTESKHGYANNVAYYAFNLSASDRARFKPCVPRSHWFHEIIFLIHDTKKSRYSPRRKGAPVLVFSTRFSLKLLIIRENVAWMKFNYCLKWNALEISSEIFNRLLIVKLYSFIFGLSLKILYN